MLRPYDLIVTGFEPTSAPTSYPREAARTRNFTLGHPRSFRVAADGSRVSFLRSRGGRDPVTCLWVLDVATATERLVADPVALGGDGDLPDVERARRERTRERATGITSYSIDPAARTATFALAGQLGVADLVAGRSSMLPVDGPVADPQPAPDGSGRIAFVRDGAVVVVDAGGVVLQEVRGPAGTSCGLPEFIAAEEFGRGHGFWWAPDGSALLVAVVDETPVQTWYVADPAHPQTPPVPQRYPAAGTANAVVSLLLAPSRGGSATPVSGWDSAQLPYLTSVAWSAGGLVVTVLSRDQRREAVLRVDPQQATARTVSGRTSDSFVDLVPGLPALLDDGRLLTALDDHSRDIRRIALDGQPLSPVDVHVSAVRHAGDGAVVVVGTTDDPTVRHVYAIPLPPAPTVETAPQTGVTAPAPTAHQLSTVSGVHDAVVGGGVVVSISSGWEHAGPRVVVRTRSDRAVAIASYAQAPPLMPRVRIVRGGDHDLRIAIVLPRDHVPGTRLPVLLDPYGGPHHAEVLAVQALWWEPQWLADQGFAVVVADGRGTPGRGLRWEQAIRGDLASAPLADQVEALGVAAAHEPDLDTGRVAIRGWSFGGYLAALAVLRRPDVFHAAVAGAPVTDWSLYDTGYTERYLGPDPRGADASAYTGSSLLAEAPSLIRPLLLVHGLADDNVVAAHTLRLSAALLAHGRAHDVLPITGATHMASAEDVAENLLLLQVDWLRRNLPDPGRRPG
jgi:dipeptidyl-peptidase-4